MIPISGGPHATPRLELPLAGGEADRVRDVARYDGLPEGWWPLHELAQEAARTAEVPMVAINLMKATTQHTVAAVGMDLTVTGRVHSMCGSIIGVGRAVHVRDASLDERWADKPFVDGRWGKVRFYGAHPLVSRSGYVLGTLCVLDELPRTLRPAQLDALDTLAHRVVDALETWPSRGDLEAG